VSNRGPSTATQVHVVLEMTDDLQVSGMLKPLVIYRRGLAPGMGDPPTGGAQHVEWTAANVPPGGKVSTWFRLTVGVRGGTKTVSATTAVLDPYPANNTNTRMIVPNPTACPSNDFAEKAVDPSGPVCPTGELFYMALFQHRGATTADLTDALDPCLDPATVSALMPDPECALNGTTIVCTGLALDASGQGQISFAAQPKLSCTPPVSIRNDARVRFNDGFVLTTNTVASQVVGCEQACGNGVDDDGDGLTDCADPDCQGQSCDDGNTCTTTDHCDAGVCRGVPVCGLVADRLEVTQAVQDLNNSVRLVANKRTFVRFHVHSLSGPQVATAVLHVQHGGATTTLAPINPSGQIVVRGTPNRALPDDAFLFQLPSAFRKGTVVLTGELDGNMTVTDTVTFEDVPEQNLVLYSFGYELDGVTYYPPAQHLSQATVWLRRTYPLNNLQVVLRSALYGSGTLSSDKLNLTEPTCTQVDGILTTKRSFDLASSPNIPANERYYGMVADGGGFMRGCAASIPGLVASGPDGAPRGSWAWDTDGSYGDWYCGHELAHTFGRYHAEFCGALDGRPYPYPDGRISPSLIGATAQYGFDVATRDIYTPDWEDVMTYCSYQWISDFTYHGLLDAFEAGGGAAAVARDENRTDRLLVVGSIDPQTNRVQLQPLFIVPNAGDLKPRIPGPYAIVLRNTVGAELARYPFTPQVIHEGPGPATDRVPDRSVDLLFIDELVPFIEGTTRVDIEGPGGLLRTVTAGANTPTVTLLSPNGGEVLDQPTVTVAWSASDADGDALVFDIQYSNDNGTTWEMVAQNLTGDHVALDALNISRAAQGRFRVLASDGIHTSSDDSDAPFTVPNRIPSVQIIEPAAAVTIAAGQTLGLEGAAYDVDTGTMTDAQLQWSSSIDGVLGHGTSLATSTLGVGIHTITFRADDGEGGIATDTVPVTVVRDLTQLPAVPDALTAGPSPIVFEPARGRTSATLSIGNENVRNALSWTAVADAPWVQLSAASGTTPAEITVHFNATALPVGTNAATLTVTSAAGSVAIGVEAVILPCAGDCDGSDTVTIDELIRGVNIALDNLPSTECPAFDVSGDATVTIDELLAAVNRALNGCS
jgi:hypothetical protein